VIRTPPTDVVIGFVAAQERAVRISKQAAEVDSVSLELVRRLVEGMMQVVATFVPREREVEALDALYSREASLVPGVVRLCRPPSSADALMQFVLQPPADRTAHSDQPVQLRGVERADRARAA